MTINISLIRASETQAGLRKQAVVELLDALGITVECSASDALSLYNWHRQHDPRIPEYENAQITEGQKARAH